MKNSRTMAWRWTGYIVRLRDCATDFYCRLIRTGFTTIRPPLMPGLRAASRHAIGRELTWAVVRQKAAVIISLELTSRLRRNCAPLAALVGQNDDYKKSSTGKRIVINQNQNRVYRERCCCYFAQVGVPLNSALGEKKKLKKWPWKTLKENLPFLSIVVTAMGIQSFSTTSKEIGF